MTGQEKSDFAFEEFCFDSGRDIKYIVPVPTSHCAKVQKYEQGKIGLQFFDMWCLYSQTCH